MTKFRITENIIRQMVREAIVENMPSNFNDEKSDYIKNQQKNWSQEERELYTEFLSFLEKSMVKGVRLKTKPSGCICVSIPTDEYNNHARIMADLFAKRKNMWVNDEMYPATTYLYLERQYGK
jgi:hypothetical protein